MNYLAHIAGAIQALRDPGSESAEQTVALDRAVETLQSVGAQSGLAFEGAAPAALDPAVLDRLSALESKISALEQGLNSEVIGSAISGMILQFTLTDQFKQAVDGSVASYFNSEAGEAVFGKSLQAYMEENGGIPALGAAAAGVLGASGGAGGAAPDPAAPPAAQTGEGAQAAENGAAAGGGSGEQAGG